MPWTGTLQIFKFMCRPYLRWDACGPWEWTWVRAASSHRRFDRNTIRGTCERHAWKSFRRKNSVCNLQYIGLMRGESFDCPMCTMHTWLIVCGERNTEHANRPCILDISVYDRRDSHAKSVGIISSLISCMQIVFTLRGCGHSFVPYLWCVVDDVFALAKQHNHKLHAFRSIDMRNEKKKLNQNKYIALVLSALIVSNLVLSEAVSADCWRVVNRVSTNFQIKRCRMSIYDCAGFHIVLLFCGRFFLLVPQCSAVYNFYFVFIPYRCWTRKKNTSFDWTDSMATPNMS